MNPTRIQSLLADHHKWHDTYQCRHFIVAKNGATAYGQYKQALRELYTRWNALRMEVADRYLLEADLEDLFAEPIPDYPHTAERRRQVEIVKKQVALESADFALRERVREFYEFYLLADALQREVGQLTEERRAELSAEEWRAQMENRLALTGMTAELRATIAAMRPDHQSDLTTRADTGTARLLAPKLPALPETVRITDALVDSTVALAREDLGLPPALPSGERHPS